MVRDIATATGYWLPDNCPPTVLSTQLTSQLPALLQGSAAGIHLRVNWMYFELFFYQVTTVHYYPIYWYFINNLIALVPFFVVVVL